MTVTATTYIAAVKSSTCETCRNGRRCHGARTGGPGPTGCGHYGCFGKDATGDCSEAIRLTAIREGR